MSASANSQSDLRERILSVLKDSPKPVTVSDLVKRVKSKREKIQTELESALAANDVHQWTGRSKSYWFVSQDEKAREAVLQAVAIQALSKVELGKAAAKVLRGLSAVTAETYVTALKAEKKLQEVPPFVGRSRLYIRTGDGQAYRAAAHAFVNQKLIKAGFEAADAYSEKNRSSTPLPDAAESILQAIQALEPINGVPVSTLRLRKRLHHLGKREFDQAALALRHEQKVILSQHVDPYNTSQDEKDLLIDGQDGTYYVAIALR